MSWMSSFSALTDHCMAADHTLSAAGHTKLCVFLQSPETFTWQSNITLSPPQRGHQTQIWKRQCMRPGSNTSGWFRPKYSGPAMAVLGGGGRSSPAALPGLNLSVDALQHLQVVTPNMAVLADTG